jgi:nucleoside-diphosphate-sugar epimerase
MKALLLGATGFTGSYVAPRLIDAGFDVTCFVRPTSDRSHVSNLRLSFVEGDLGDVAALTSAMRGHDVLVSVASIGFGHGPGIVAAAQAAGIARAVFVSTTAIFTTLNARTKSVRMEAEDAIRNSGLAWTIVRPTMIYGSDRDRNMSRLIRYMRRWPVLFVAGSGRHLQQPVHVDDVAQAIVDAIRCDAAIGRAYNIAGAAPLTFNEVIDTVSRTLGKRMRRIHLPLRPVVTLLQAFERLRIRLPVRAEQILRLEEDKAFPYDDAARDFGFAPRSFGEGIAEEVSAALRARESAPSGG